MRDRDFGTHDSAQMLRRDTQDVTRRNTHSLSDTLPAMPSDPALIQSSLPGFCPLAAAVESLALNEDIEKRGAIFTRREVVDFILDLVSYTPDRPLHRHRLLEPSFGHGDFLLPAIERLLERWRRSGDTTLPLECLGSSIRAVEIHHETFRRTRTKVLARLVGAGIAAHVAEALADSWLIPGDFLLSNLPDPFDMVVGNPPYVRQELIPDVLLAEYRRRYRTIYDRADLYIPFIERSLRSLAQGGVLGFICADRWMKNRYGGPLRELVADAFHLRAYIDMTDTQAFHSEVMAYPAITIIAREEPGVTRIAHRPAIEATTLATLSAALTAQHVASDHPVREIAVVGAGAAPWLLDTPIQTALVRRLEQCFPTLEEAGCKIGIGVATGADRAFIAPLDTLDVESDRKLPLVTTRDIRGGTVVWQGLGIINPFADQGGLVCLDDYPRLKRYLELHKDLIARRHCAQKVPAHWYRTIDRITPALARTPKLLIPDIKGDAHIVYEDGHLYPHHNLYFITAEDWDLWALQAVLLSGIARLFIATYSTRMRGGYLRFQAQYLRRIRIPRWQDVSDPIRQQLRRAAVTQDRTVCNQAIFDLYGLSPAERMVLEDGAP